MHQPRHKQQVFTTAVRLVLTAALLLLYLRHIVHQPRHTRLRCLYNLLNRKRQLVDIDILNILVPGCRYFSTRPHTHAPPLSLQPFQSRATAGRPDILVPGCRYFSTRLHTTTHQLIALQLLQLCCSSVAALLQLCCSSVAAVPSLAPPSSAPPFQSLADNGKRWLKKKSKKGLRASHSGTTTHLTLRTKKIKIEL